MAHATGDTIFLLISSKTIHITFSSDALQSIVTALYCKILVILGLAFPMAEVISDSVPHGYYQLFYVYLFLGSLLFLLFIYIDLLRTRARQSLISRRRKRRESKSASNHANMLTNQLNRSGRDSGSALGGSELSPGGSVSDGDDLTDARGGGGRQVGVAALMGRGSNSSSKENLLPMPRVHYGSFYLRLGCVSKWREGRRL